MMKKGSTAIKSMVVIAIIAISAAIVVPILVKAGEKAHLTRYSSHRRQTVRPLAADDATKNAASSNIFRTVGYRQDRGTLYDGTTAPHSLIRVAMTGGNMTFFNHAKASYTFADNSSHRSTAHSGTMTANASVALLTSLRDTDSPTNSALTHGPAVPPDSFSRDLDGYPPISAC